MRGGVAFDRWSHVEIWLYYNYPWMQEWPDHFTFLWNCPPTPPLSQHYTKFLLRAKCWLRRGVGGQFHRNVKWSKWPILDYIVDEFNLWLWTHSKGLTNHTFYFIFPCAFWWCILLVASQFQQTNDCLFFTAGDWYDRSNICSHFQRIAWQVAFWQPFSIIYKYCHVLHLSDNRDLKIHRQRREREHQKSGWFKKQNSNSARASCFFVHFFSVTARLRRQAAQLHL